MLFTIGLIISLGLVSQWIGWKFKIPVIICLLLTGFFVGPVLGVIDPLKVFGQDMIFAIVELSVALILFDGAMQLRFKEFKEVSKGLNRILSIGVIIHFILITGTAKFVMDVSWGFAALLGGILIVTGPTVIIPALREANMNKNVSRYLKWEGILTDPVGAIVAVVVYDAIVLSEKTAAFDVFLALTSILVISLLFSFGAKFLLEKAIKHKFVPEFLQIPFVTTMVAASFVFSNEIQHGSGLLTVTILGLLVGNSKLDILFDIRTFKENITTMAISFVFIIITASIPLSVFKMIELKHMVFIFMVTFVLRVAAIYLSTMNTNLKKREKFLIGFFGPRGIVAASVAAVLSAEMVNSGIVVGEIFLPIVFLVIISTVICHSILLKPICKVLNLESKNSNGIIFIGTMPWVADLALKLKNMGIPVLVTSASWYKLAPFRKLGINCYYGKILDRLETEDFDLSDYSFLMAMSENDSFNILACERFSKYLGVHNVYHLKQSRNFVHDQYQIDKNSYCVLVNSLELRYENLMKYYEYGWNFKDTKLTENYDFQEYLNDNDKSIICMCLRQNGSFEFGSQFDEQPQPGDILISFSPKFSTSENKVSLVGDSA